jgi:hypothetical protein
MEAKDFITIAISVAAFMLSLIATFVTLRNKKYEEERTLRSLLSDAIAQIHTARIDQAKYQSERR